jgi:hypothetical protein
MAKTRNKTRTGPTKAGVKRFISSFAGLCSDEPGGRPRLIADAMPKDGRHSPDDAFRAIEAKLRRVARGPGSHSGRVELPLVRSRFIRKSDRITVKVVVAVVVACVAGCIGMVQEETANTSVALEFAKAIARGDAQLAHGMLSARLRSEFTPDELAAEYQEMISYGSGAPTILAVMTTLDSWPDKQPGDTEWVYVAIANDTYSEAVTVVVSKESSGLVIRSIEWGRP